MYFFFKSCFCFYSKWQNNYNNFRLFLPPSFPTTSYITNHNQLKILQNTAYLRSKLRIYLDLKLLHKNTWQTHDIFYVYQTYPDQTFPPVLGKLHILTLFPSTGEFPQYWGNFDVKTRHFCGYFKIGIPRHFQILIIFMFHSG